MIKVFCDKCGKEITYKNRYIVDLSYDKPNYKLTSHRHINVVLCEECNEKVTTELHKVVNLIRGKEIL